MTDKCYPISDEQLGRLLEHLESLLKWKAQVGWEMAEEPDLTGSEGTMDPPEQLGRDPHHAVVAAIKETRQPLCVDTRAKVDAGWDVR